eukprot:365715-Chlamydomonas_euryale.AAC.2
MLEAVQHAHCLIISIVVVVLNELRLCLFVAVGARVTSAVVARAVDHSEGGATQVWLLAHQRARLCPLLDVLQHAMREPIAPIARAVRLPVEQLIPQRRAVISVRPCRRLAVELGQYELRSRPESMRRVQWMGCLQAEVQLGARAAARDAEFKAAGRLPR